VQRMDEMPLIGRDELETVHDGSGR